MRTNFVAGEYPASLARLFAWSPDEAIPEFFCDPTIFTSLHEDMVDLAVPEWAAGAEDFVKRHR